MRVALSVDALEPRLTGIGNYTLELARGLASHPDISELSFFRGKIPIADPDKLLVPRFSWHRSRPGRWWHSKRNAGILDRMRSAIVHAPNFFLPSWAEHGVATIHDLSVFRFPETHPEFRRRHFEERFEDTITRAGRVITGTSAMRAQLVAALGLDADRIDVVPHGVHAPVRPSGDEVVRRLRSVGLEQGAYCLCVSTIEPRKRIRQLLDAYEKLPRSRRLALPLVLVGKAGWLAEDLVSRLNQAQAEGWAKWLGFASAPMLDALYFGARLFIYPSLYEGFGLPPVEAMAHGVPVLISDDESLVEVSGSAAMIVSADDPKSFAASITRGIDDVAWREAATLNGSALAARLSWQRTVDGTVDAYRRLSL